MRTAELLPPAEPVPARGRRPGAGAQGAEWAAWAAWAALAAILAVALTLRLWGIREGLPYVYSVDEASHFVPHAIRMFEEGTLNPHYFANPPAFTYLLHAVFALAYGGGAGAVRELHQHPASVYTLARVCSALLGTLAVWLLYLTGARLLGRAAGLLAAALLAVAFLPVFYSHWALNDAPALAPLTLSLLGSAGVLRSGRAREYALAGIGLGLACATKYTAGVVLAPLLAACGARIWRGGRAGARREIALLCLAGACALAAFVAANPYALLDFRAFAEGIAHQSQLSGEAQGKLGAPRESGIVYYLWALTWGLGWVPALAAPAGAVLALRGERRVAALLVPGPVLFLIFMGLEGRYFGRWVIPIIPFCCLLAAIPALALARASTRLARGRAGSRGRPALAGLALGALLAALLAQGLIYSVHSGLVLARADTRQLAREWMLAHVPRGSRIVAEPVSLEEWDRERGGTGAQAWQVYPALLQRVDAHGRLIARPHPVGIEDYERTLAPALLGWYEAEGYCWVLTGSTEEGRAQADPRAVPLALAYYRALARSASVVYRASPYASGAGPVAFSFDWSFDYYPLAYERPGPLVTIYRLHGGLCGAR